jgi:predicted nucleotidyltransferase
VYRNKALTILRRDRAEIQRFGVKSLDIFDSVARDEAKSDVGVDLPVEFEGKVTFRSLSPNLE